MQHRSRDEQPSGDAQQWLSLEEAARRLGVSLNHVRSVAGTEKLRAKPDGLGGWLYSEEDVDAWVRQQKHPKPRWWTWVAITFLVATVAGVVGTWGYRQVQTAETWTRAQGAAKAGNWAEAGALSGQVLLSRPDDPKALSLAAQAALKQQQVAQGYVLLKRLETMGALDVSRSIDLALAAQRLGYDQEAEEALRAVLDKHPDHYYANVLLAGQEVKDGQAPQALARLTRLQERAPSPLLAAQISELKNMTAGHLSGVAKGAGDGDFAAHPLVETYNRARAAQMRGEDEAAVQGYTTVLSQEPVMALSHNNLALHYLQRTGEDAEGVQKALDHARRAYLLAPDNWAVTDTLCLIALRMKDYKEALLWSDAGMKLQVGDRPLAHYRRVMVMRGLGKMDKAREEANKAGELLRKGGVSEISQTDVDTLLASLKSTPADNGGRDAKPGSK